MTDPVELVKINEGTPVKYVWSSIRGHRLRVPVKAVRRVCDVCGEEFWAWENTFDWVCVKCQAAGVEA